MLEAIASYFAGRTSLEVARDLFDIFIVYYLFYRLLLIARGTRAIQIAAGLGIVSLFYVFAQMFELITIVTIVGALLQSMILVIVVVFQNDIRRALQRVGSRAIFGGARAQTTQVIEQVVEAARILARHRIGAIIAFEQDANLDEFVGQNKGINLDAQISTELLVSLFIPEGENKLHDGAVVVRNLRIARGGVFFPMPENRSFESSFGSRHRAALGITEETDAVVVVVSEERGTISFCYNGNIAPDLQANQLREMLLSIMSPKARPISRHSSAPEIHETTDLAAHRPTGSRAMGARTPGSRPSEVPPPISTRPGSIRPAALGATSDQEEQPKPLRKSNLPDLPRPESSSDSFNVPLAEPRPMPKAAEVELSNGADDSNLENESPRSDEESSPPDEPQRRTPA